MKLVFVVIVLHLSSVKAQCYHDSGISLYHSQYPPYHYQEDGTGRPQCIPNYAVLCETTIDDTPDKGITCSKKGSTDTNGYWKNDTNGAKLDCSNGSYDYTTQRALCQTGSGSVTIYTPLDGYDNPPTNFTCYIDGSSVATIRVLRYVDFQAYFQNNGNAAELEICIIIPPSDITAIPQQYLVQMNTSVIPFSRLSSLIPCTNGDGITCEQSFYTLINLDAERFQMTVPVTWSTNSITNTDHYYSCRVRFGGQNENGLDSTVLSKIKLVSIKASSAPSSVSYEVVNATAINILWSISGDVNGFLITVDRSGLDNITKHKLSDGSVREYVINGLLLDTNYTVEVRGYHELLGPAGTIITVRLEGGITGINGSLLSVSDNLSTQLIQVNCYTYGIKPHQVTWAIDSVSIVQSSSSYISGETYRHYIMLNGVFSDETTIYCNAIVNGEKVNEGYTLQAPSSPPTGLSATILSSTSLSISWSPLSSINGYVIQYTGGQPIMVDGEDSSSSVLEGLTPGTTYQINIYSYSDLLSNISGILISLNVPMLTSYDVKPVNSTSVQLSWSLSDTSIIDNYTLLGIRSCDKIMSSVFVNGNKTSIVLNHLSSGFQYTIVLSPFNGAGKGMGRSSTVRLMESIPPSAAPIVKSLVTINSTAVKVTWEEVSCSHSNGNITGYRVLYYINGDAQQCILFTDVITSTVITGLMESQLYYISVAAVNSIGAGPYSEREIFHTFVDVATRSSNSAGSTSAVVTGLSVMGIIILILMLLLIIVPVLVWNRIKNSFKFRINKTVNVSDCKEAKIPTTDVVGVQTITVSLNNEQVEEAIITNVNASAQTTDDSPQVEDDVIEMQQLHQPCGPQQCNIAAVDFDEIYEPV